ncbi:unnamed protein product [Chrysodeixis includens]|uniref:AN1-type zinc finger protein 1 n=1 Tax=Chrysodeixis includens TaxID=689277 RepID=A0A9P0BL41_CHRIL|nr:unnamed protein product [Chrysodeixis includens]
MEFPTLGEHCQYQDCNQIDFLPIQCKCGQVFCRQHYNEHSLSGECKLAPEPKEVNLKHDDQIFRCSEKGCKKGDLPQMLCSKCNKHYCVEHRFHPSCPEIDDETMAAKIEQFEVPRRMYKEANKHLQEKITENIRKALQSSKKVQTASKVHLMRIKSKAVGPKQVTPVHRVFFSIKKPVDMKPKPVKIVKEEDCITNIETVTLDPDLKDTVAVFISSQWTLGRAIDGICDSCNIKNDNNKVGPVKLRLFRQLDNYCISPLKMDVEIAELLKTEVLLEGDKLVMEYIDSNILNDIDENAQLFLI